MKKSYFSLLIILLLGICLRLYDLGSESLWVDEVSTVKNSKLSFVDGILDPFNNHPLHGILLHFWIRLFGDSEYSVRFPSVVFGVFSIIMVFFLGRQLFDEDAGLISAFLLSVSVFNISFSQEARAYALFVLLCIFSYYCLILFLESGKRIYSIANAIASGLCIWAHPYGVFILLAQYSSVLVYALRFPRVFRINRNWLKTQVITAIICFIYIFVMFSKGDGMFSGTAWIEPPSSNDVINSFNLFTGLTYAYLFPYPADVNLLYSQTLYCFWIVLIIASLYSLFVYSKKAKECRRPTDIFNIFLLASWFFTLTIFPLLISITFKPIFFSRFLIAATPVFYMLIAHGISSIGSEKTRNLILMILLFSSLCNARIYYVNQINEDWRGVADFVDSIADENDRIVFNNCYLIDSFNYYSNNTGNNHTYCISNASDLDDDLSFVLNDPTNQRLILVW
ncbi:MAG: glycosyltransferase family 39 protein, partial [Candidatus Altiarchaeota archaeon]|nr:glycosyltransferase family 39 protein [Candidatus Altiarchaeota archaeon]